MHDRLNYSNQSGSSSNNTSSSHGISSSSSSMQPPSQQMWTTGRNSSFQPSISYQQMLQSAHTASNYRTSQQPSASSSSQIDCKLIPFADLSQEEKNHLCEMIVDILSVESREDAVRELSKRCETIIGLPEIVWNTDGVVMTITNEVIRISSFLSPTVPPMNATTTSYACNLMNLIQTFASRKEIRKELIQSKIVHLLTPFVRLSSRLRSMEYLRLVTLGVFGALVKADDGEIVKYLIGHDIIPSCLKVMEVAPDISKVVGAFILQKIIADDFGLNYICQTYDRFSQMAMILGRIVLQVGKEPEPRLLKHVIRCYLRLSENPRAGQALQTCIPESLKNGTFHECLRDDALTLRMLNQLLYNIEQSRPAPNPQNVSVSVASVVPSTPANQQQPQSTSSGDSFFYLSNRQNARQ